jgi:pilus assembly protein Flp/PilA
MYYNDYIPNLNKEVNAMLFAPKEQEKGQGLVEYALILVLVAVVVIVILALLGPAIGNVFSNIVANI